MSKKIILADDHDVVRRGLKQILADEMPDAQITEASSALELLKRVREASYDMAISDISMPGMNGLELVAQLNKEFPNLPVLILSIHAEDQYAIRALRAGAMGYLSKGSASTELVLAIRQILNGKKYITSTIAELLADNVLADKKLLQHELLSNREFEVLKLLAGGKTVHEIADSMSVSVNTVHTYRSRIMAKMKLKTNADLILYAIQQKLVS